MTRIIEKIRRFDYFVWSAIVSTFLCNVAGATYTFMVMRDPTSSTTALSILGAVIGFIKGIRLLLCKDTEEDLADENLHSKCKFTMTLQTAITIAIFIILHNHPFILHCVYGLLNVTLNTTVNKMMRSIKVEYYAHDAVKLTDSGNMMESGAAIMVALGSICCVILSSSGILDKYNWIIFAIYGLSDIIDNIFIYLIIRDIENR